MINYRNGVFETNSSTVHALCIGKDSLVQPVKSVIFKHASFGNYSDKEVYISKDARASYLYELLLHDASLSGVPFEDSANVKTVKKYLDDKNILYAFEDETENTVSFYDNRYGYANILDYILASSDNFMQYLFGDNILLLVKYDHYMVDDARRCVVSQIDKARYKCVVA